LDWFAGKLKLEGYMNTTVVGFLTRKQKKHKRKELDNHLHVQDGGMPVIGGTQL